MSKSAFYFPVFDAEIAPAKTASRAKGRHDRSLIIQDNLRSLVAKFEQDKNHYLADIIDNLYFPKSRVDYIVKYTVGKLIDGRPRSRSRR
jgi:hypothetical protein